MIVGHEEMVGSETGIDIWQDYNPNAPGYSPLRPNESFITFEPQK